MGTFVVISAWGRDRAVLHRAVTHAFEEIHRVDSRLSLHREDSELSSLNALAAEGWREVSPDLFEVLALAQSIAQETKGAFDMTIRPLADLWGFIWKEYRLPAAAELQRVLPRVNWRLVEMNATNRTVRFLAPDISIDLGGIGKGYAVDRAVEVLESHGIGRVLVRAGGDVRVTGPPPGEKHWPIQLEDPAKGGNRTVVALVHRALSTSGNYENYFEVDGRRYSHLLDPRSGMPVSGLAACSVTAPTCAESDAWATACFVLGPKESLARFGRRFGMKFSLPPASPDEPWAVERSSRFPPERPVPERGSMGSPTMAGNSPRRAGQPETAAPGGRARSVTP